MDELTRKRSLQLREDDDPVRKRLRQVCPQDASLHDLPDLLIAGASHAKHSAAIALAHSRTSVFDDDQADRRQVEQQAILAKLDLFWGFVAKGNAKGVLSEVQRDPQVLCRRGPVGETPLHMLVLFSHFELAKAIATRYPVLLVDKYREAMYRGENCLHIAIVQRDLDMVHFLLETSRADGTLDELLSARADGDFFAKGTPCFFGEYPLGFAVCTNQGNIVRLLVESFGSSLELVDSYENNLLHLAVEHKLPQMYDLVVDLWKDWAPKHATDLKPLTKRLNAEKLTPLCTAAKYGFCEIFDHILNATCEVQWSYGPVTCVWLPLEDVDYIVGRKSGAIEHIVQEGHLDLLTLPLIQEILMKKWNNFAKTLFIGRFKWALAQAVAYTLMVVFLPPSISIFPFPSWDAMDKWAAEGGFIIVLLHVLCKLFVTVLMGQKMYIECREMATEGIENHFDFSGAAIFENTVSLSMCCCFFVSQLLELTGSEWDDTMLAITGILVWSYLLWFMLGYQGTGHLVVMVWKIILQDMTKFACVTSIFLVSFSLASFIITTAKPDRGWMSFTVHLFDFFHGMMSGFDKDHHINQGSLFLGLVVSYSILVTILLLNILIAMMSDTYNKVCESAEKRWQLERARIIVTMEKEMSREEIEKQKYWIQPQEGGERYLQFEKTSATWATDNSS